MSMFVIFDSDENIYLKKGKNITKRDPKEYDEYTYSIEDGLLISNDVEIFRNREDAEAKLKEVKHSWEILDNLAEGTFDDEYDGISIIEIFPTIYTFYLRRDN